RVHYLPNALEAPELARLGALAEARPRSGPALDHAEARLLLYSRLFEFEPDRLARIFARVRAGVPEARLVVLGDALRGEDATFRRALAAEGVLGAADFVGWPGREQAACHFVEAAVALSPFDAHLINRARSSFKLLELMAAGLPIVAEAVGQNALCLEHGRSGLLVEPGDEAAFAAHVIRLLRSPEEAGRLGQAA